MQRGTVLMMIGLAMQIANWIISSTMSHSPAFQSYKGSMGTVTIFGWMLFFAGFALRYLDRRRVQAGDAGKRPRR